MREFPSVRVDSTGNITSPFPPYQKDSNIVITGGSYLARVAIFAYSIYVYIQIKVVKEFVSKTSYPDILCSCQYHRGFQLRVSSRSLRNRLAVDRSDATGDSGQRRHFSSLHIG